MRLSEADALLYGFVSAVGVTDEVLAAGRSSIDNIDAAVVLLLAERFKVTERLGAHKAKAGLPPEDPVREREQISRLCELAVDAGLDPSFTERFLRLVISEVVRRHHSMRENCGIGCGA